MEVVSVSPHLAVQWWPPHTILSGLPVNLASKTVLRAALVAANLRESLTTTMPPKPTTFAPPPQGYGDGLWPH